MGIKIGAVNADTVVKIGSTTIQAGYIGFKQFYNTYTSILDLYPSAYYAYSLRKLKSTYTGFCLRVRRTTTTPTITTTTVDLGFDVFNTISMNSPITVISGLGTTSAKTLGEFAIGTVDGFTAHSVINVVTWYDQSGNNRNVTNATGTQQPRLVRLDSGVATLETSGGKAAVRFTNASAQRLVLTNTSVSLNNVSSYALGSSIALTNNAILSMGDTIGTNIFWLPQASLIAYRTTSTFTGNGNVANQPRLYELICDTSIANAYANGNILAPTAGVAAMTGTNSVIRLGQYSTTVFMNGYITEVISFVGTSNRTNIESNINTYYSVW